MTVAILLFYLLFPALLIFLGTKYAFINRIGVVVFCYVGGLIIGNSGIVPGEMTGIQGDLMGAVILLGIPLVLFSENIMKWIKMAKYTFISLLLGVVSVVIMVFVGYFLFKDHIPESHKVAGMLIGVYTGGTPNLAAIAQGLNVDEDLYILTHTVDLAIGALVLLFLITGAQRFFRLFMKPYKFSGQEITAKEQKQISEFESYDHFFKAKNIPGLLASLGVGIVVFGVGFAATFLFEGDAKDTAAILTVTTAGILLSMVPRVHKLKNSFQLGMYFIYVFCVIVASKANLKELFSPDSWELLKYLLMYVGMAVVGSLFLHSLLSWIFGVNTDDFIMTSTALSNSPPFVPVVAAALKNKEVMIPGMIIGVIGYAIGNYLGVFIAYLLK
jgi:uncharacterized membrane protein